MEQRPPVGRAENGNGDMRRELEQIERQMAERLANLRSQIGRMNEVAVTFIRRNPGASLVMAAAAGFLIGRLLRI
jgi:ElaB/YqjD/DUF883 family membrane-anchored ribosome-binding protein